jgi:hypothetical protein
VSQNNSETRKQKQHLKGVMEILEWHGASMWSFIHADDDDILVAICRKQ